EKNNKIILSPSATVINTDRFVPSFTVFGFVRTTWSKEPMIDATIIDSDDKKITLTNTNGYFTLALPEGDRRLQISYGGFSTKTIDLSLHADLRLDIEMSLLPVLRPVVVEAGEPLKKNAADKIANEKSMTAGYFLGENDPLKSISFLPGVLNLSENFSNIQVRGGGPDENLFLLDGTQVYNPTHFLGALSIINPTVIKTLRLYKSDFPARFSGSLSSVMDVYTKEGNMEKWQGEIAAGILSGAVTLEGPVAKNKTSIMASFRHSWANPLWLSFQNNLKPDFYDVHAKLTQVLGVNDKLVFNFYRGQDNLNQTGTNTNNLHKWSNLLGALKWNHLFGAKSFISTSVDFNQYHNQGAFKYSVLDDNEEEVQTKSIGTFSSIEHYNAKLNGEFLVSGKTRINAGLYYNHTITRPFETRTTAQLDESEHGFSSFSPLAFDVFSGYAELEYKPFSRLVFRPGLHLSDYMFKGYKFFSLQPRFYSAFQFNKKNQLFFAYSKMTQYMHLVSNPYLGLNADLWVPSVASLTPEESESFTLGYELKKRKFILSLAGYYRVLKNVTNYVNGKSYFITDSTWQQNLEPGKGSAYGMETMFQWQPGKFLFKFSYTLSWSWRQFPDINQGRMFPYKYDRRHVTNLALAYNISPHFDISGSFTFASGEAVLLPGIVNPTGSAQQNNGEDDIAENYQFIYQYTDSNQYRSAPYYRENFSISYHSLSGKKMQTVLTAGVYNISGATDQYAYDLLGSVNSQGLVPRIIKNSNNLYPYISYILKF
ncbi:MAG: TonB-dependent receptor, partial [Bacteroidetes bacterium]|nr:TonB-dependent receptor [Bacteroidota bacterium]